MLIMLNKLFSKPTFIYFYCVENACPQEKKKKRLSKFCCKDFKNIYFFFLLEISTVSFNIATHMVRKSYLQDNYYF